jgi:hypothetical protein
VIDDTDYEKQVELAKIVADGPSMTAQEKKACIEREGRVLEAYVYYKLSQIRMWGLNSMTVTINKVYGDDDESEGEQPSIVADLSGKNDIRIREAIKEAIRESERRICEHVEQCIERALKKVDEHLLDEVDDQEDEMGSDEEEMEEEEEEAEEVKRPPPQKKKKKKRQRRSVVPGMEEGESIVRKFVDEDDIIHYLLGTTCSKCGEVKDTNKILRKHYRRAHKGWYASIDKLSLNKAADALKGYRVSQSKQ